MTAADKGTADCDIRGALAFLSLSSTDFDGEEMLSVRSVDQQQDAGPAGAFCVRQISAHIGGGADVSASDTQNDIAAMKPFVRRVAVRIDRRHHDALGVITKPVLLARFRAKRSKLHTQSVFARLPVAKAPAGVGGCRLLAALADGHANILLV